MEYGEAQLQKDRAARHQDAQGMVVSYGPHTGCNPVDLSKISQPVKLSNLTVNWLGHPCNCIGPQGNEPRCPCAMRGVVKRDGRWIQTEVDLGPVV